MPKITCPACRTNPRPGQRTCRKCHAAAMRVYRKKRPLFSHAEVAAIFRSVRNQVDLALQKALSEALRKPPPP